MAPRKRISLRNKLAAKKKQEFIGREQQLAIFRATFNDNAADEEIYNIFNIYGQGGIGKTTISHQYSRIAKENDAIVAFLDLESDINNIPALMAEIVKQLEEQKANFSEFEAKYTTFLQEKERLEKDPEAPKGFFNMIGSTLTKVAIAKTEKFIGAELSEVLPKEAMAALGGDAVSFIHKKITNKDELQLILDPIEVLTPIFIAEIDKNSNDFDICIVFDTYETAFPKLDDWLRGIYNFQYGEGIDRLLTVISGREELSEKWQSLAQITQKILLEQFTEEEAIAFLKSKNITEEAVLNTLVEVSDRFPVLLSLFAQNPPTSPEEIHDVSGTAIERFLKWIKSDEEKSVLLAAALPRAINQDMVAALLKVLNIDAVKCTIYYNLLNRQPFVQQRGDIKTYHPVVKAQMLKHQYQNSPKTWRNQHYALTQYFETEAAELGLETLEKQYHNQKWLELHIEATYHKLCANFHKELPGAVEGMAIHLEKTLTPQNMVIWSQIILSAGQLVGEEDSSSFITKGVAGVISDDAIIAATFFDEIVAKGWIKEKLAQGLFVFLVAYYAYESRELDKAIANYEKAIELNPTYATAYNNLGIAYSDNKELDKAIANYEKATELNPTDATAFYNLGNAYKANKELDKAIANYEKAIELNPTDTTAYNNLGNAYSDNKELDKAIANYEKAIELNPTNATAYNNLGVAYSDNKELDKAIANYEKTIELNPTDATAYNNLGVAYKANKELDKAIANYEKAIELNPTNATAYNNLGNAYKANKELDKAIANYEKTIELNPTDANNWNSLGWTYLELSAFEKALHYLTKAWEIGEYEYAAMNIGHIHLLKNNTTIAIEWYKKSVLRWNDTNLFFEGMNADFVHLKMEEKGITSVAYQKILEALRQAHT